MIAGYILPIFGVQCPICNVEMLRYGLASLPTGSNDVCYLRHLNLGYLADLTQMFDGVYLEH